jgi:murein DD-endopeptidase MepM/ murein hydrolase activator NlpD
MRRAIAGAALLVVLVVAGGASAQSFTVVTSAPAGLPSPETPNAAGAIDTPFPLSLAPSQPSVLSYDQLLSLWQRAGEAYGVPWQVLAAINKVESNFGRNMGPSSAGAVGWMQFMPDTWLRWGLDANGDGLADPWNPDDAVFAAARYLAAAGGHDDISRAVFAYNHAQWYVDEVLALAADFGDGAGLDLVGSTGADAAFTVDRIQEQIAAARRALARAREAVSRFQRVADESVDRQLRLELKAGNPKIPTATFLELERRIDRLGRRADRDRARMEGRQAAVAAAVARLQTLRGDLTSASAAAPAVASFGGAQTSGDYVFPVGGGPGVVSVAHTHHDYPAADIVAPEGSPLYALADSVVVETYEDGSGRCGIGFKIRLEGGALYVYCHLSYLEPSVTPGAALAAGAPVGLVGSTGHATGPHLHLQFSPALSYPQEEPWFQSFAGVAFSWSDAPTPAPRTAPKAASKERSFTVVGITPASGNGRVVGFTR